LKIERFNFKPYRRENLKFYLKIFKKLLLVLSIKSRVALISNIQEWHCQLQFGFVLCNKIKSTALPTGAKNTHAHFKRQYPRLFCVCTFVYAFGMCFVVAAALAVNLNAASGSGKAFLRNGKAKTVRKVRQSKARDCALFTLV